MWEYLIYAIGGAIGGFAKDIVEDGGVIVLPTREKNKIRLGFITSMVTGLFAGIAVDHHFLTATLAGYAGVHAIEKVYERAKDKNGDWIPLNVLGQINDKIMRGLTNALR